MESIQRAEFPVTTYQLAEQYQVGQPLALHNMHSWWVRILRAFSHVLLGAVICMIFFMLILFAILLSQVIEGQIANLPLRLMVGLPGIITGLIACIGCLIMRNIIARRIPTSFLVYTGGLLEIRPKEVDVTHWDEVIEILQVSRLGEKKRYTFSRINRKPLFFGEAFEDIEGLANLVRQQIKKYQ